MIAMLDDRSRQLLKTRIERYIAEQEERAESLEISPNHLRELRRCARSDGTWSWWEPFSIHEIDAANLNEWRRWLAKECDLAPKSVRNNIGYFRAFVGWLFRLEKIDRLPAFPTVKVRDHQPTILSHTENGICIVSSSKMFSYAGQRIAIVRYRADDLQAVIDALREGGYDIVTANLPS